MKIKLHKSLLLISLISCALAAKAQVRIFADRIIKENSSLLARGNSLKNVTACLWINKVEEKSSACKELYVRVSKDHSKAMIYLPSVDADLQTRLFVNSGPYEQDQQEFLINIVDIKNRREELLKRFQFFTNLAANKDKSYSLAIKKDDERNFIRNSEFANKKNKKHGPPIYAAQELTFDQRAQKIREIKRKHQLKKKLETKPVIADIFRLKPRQNPPINAAMGDIYLSNSNALCIYMDDAWLKIIGSGQCIPDPSKAPVLPKPRALPKKLTI